MIANELTELFENSNINATFLTCVVESFREEMVHSTRVTANCSFQNVSTMEPINREVVYAEFSEMTDGIFSLGSYELQSNSLYVDDFTVQHNVNEPQIVPEQNNPNNQENPVPVPIEVINPIEYNVTFILDSLSIEEIQANPSDTATMIAAELTDLFNNSSINATFLKCVVESFSEVMVHSTRVTANCLFQNVSTMEPIRREDVYDVFKEKTINSSSLGPYALQRYSLYVDGYTVQPIATVPAPIDLTNDINYNVTFTVSLPIEEIQRNPSETATIIAAEIIDLFENSIINATFLTCVVESFSEKMVNNTRVTANCSFQNVSTMEPINREKVYDVFNEKTDDISSLGPHLLQSYSLYVNGYTVQPIATVPAPIDLTNDINYNVTFTVSLPIEEIQRNPSETATIIAAEIIDLFENSIINATFLTCVVKSFSGEMVNNTRVTANCSFQNVSTMEPVNREKVYDVFSEKTDDISSLGPHLLQSYSLYVNGYTVQPIATVPAPIDLTNDINYNVTFTVSLPIEEIQRNPSETATIIAAEIIDLFENSIINATFLTCVVKSFSEEMVNNTRVTANCSFQNVSTMEPVNREKVYDVFSEKTDDISSLGPHLLQSYSLYVNGYTVQPIATVPAPIDLTNDINYNVTFTVSLPIEEIQRNPSETATIIAAEIIDLFENSIINATFLTCVVKSFSEEMVNNTRVTANCSFQNVSTMEPINREKVYDVFNEKTDDISSLGPHLLQSYSLYVNGYTVQPIATVPAPIDLTNDINYNVTFTVSLPIEEIQRNPSETATIIAAEIIDLFENSIINATFLTCVVKSFSEEMVNNTRVTANCSFQNVSTMEPINREKVYDVFNEKTDDISSLGPHLLQSYSLYVNGTYQNIL
ncbi:mucin-16-like [Leucoraja erinacea]|uniref:mucin-16-like n=1 Tax=Leucoraja erinaceus TaxID=7782 RepID=UPI0024563E0D|nr:mucin-16-like [Leucoraja erinacea]